MGWISEFSYNYSLNRLEEQKKQWEYQESKAESQQAALDNGYVPAGYSYEDIARYIDDYIGYKVSWDGGLVTDVTGDMVTVCVSFDNFYGYSTPNYNKSFELDCSQAYFDNGKPLVDDHILFEGTITGMDLFTNYIEVRADSVHVLLMLSLAVMISLCHADMRLPGYLSWNVSCDGAAIRPYHGRA